MLLFHMMVYFTICLSTVVPRNLKVYDRFCECDSTNILPTEQLLFASSPALLQDKEEALIHLGRPQDKKMRPMLTSFALLLLFLLCVSSGRIKVSPGGVLLLRKKMSSGKEANSSSVPTPRSHVRPSRRITAPVRAIRARAPPAAKRIFSRGAAGFSRGAVKGMPVKMRRAVPEETTTIPFDSQREMSPRSAISKRPSSHLPKLKLKLKQPSLQPRAWPPRKPRGPHVGNEAFIAIISPM